MNTHEKYMSRALELARLAGSLGEVPVGTVIVIAGNIISEGYNRKELVHSCLAHAEIIALRNACEQMGRWRLSDAMVYSTLEPCIMCTGALLHARIGQLVFGAHDLKFGAIESLFNLSNDTRLNHRFSYISGVLAQESASLLKLFFATQRKNKNMRR